MINCPEYQCHVTYPVTHGRADSQVIAAEGVEETGEHDRTGRAAPGPSAEGGRTRGRG